MMIVLHNYSHNKQTFLKVILIIFAIFSPLLAFSFEENENDNTALLVESIETYAEGESLEDAKDTAIKNGSTDAFKSLLYKITPYDVHWKIESIVVKRDTFALIDEVVPVKERMTSHSYRATLSYKFNSTKVRNLLNSLGIRYSEKASQNVLLIPILHQKDGKLVIWSKGDWRAAWENIPPSIGLMRYNLTEGDLEDMELVDPEEIMTASYDKYETLLKIYEVENMIAVFATELDKKLEFTLRFLSTANDFFKYTTIEQNVNESEKAFYQRAALEIANKIDAEWKGIRVFEGERLYSSKLKVKYDKPNDWKTIQNHLQEIKAIKQIKLISKKSNQAEIELIYTFAPAILSEEIAKRGYTLKEDAGIMYLTKR